MNEHPKLALSTLGCRTNQAETAQLVADLSDVCAVVPFDQEADIYVINTCTVTHEADRQSRQLIRRAQQLNPEARIVVTGCAVDYRPAEFAAAPGLSLVVPNAQKGRIAQAIADWYGTQPASAHAPTPQEAGRTRAWLKISEGCNHRCSYCIVPTVRGGERSVPASQLMAQAQSLAAQGYREIVLTGTNQGAWSEGNGRDLAFLLGEFIRTVPEVARWRVASIEPFQFPPELIERFADPKVCPHVHLCLQSGSSRILQAMRRRYTAERYRSLVDELRAARPEIAFTTDVIVGFPGEGEEEFQETCRFIQDIGFAGVHLFPYSVRQGTHASTLSGTVSPLLIGQRMARLQELASETQRAWQQGFIGQTLEVLTERATTDRRPATSAHGLRVWVSAEQSEANQLRPVTILGIEDGQVRASLCEP